MLQEITRAGEPEAPQVTSRTFAEFVLEGPLDVIDGNFWTPRPTVQVVNTSSKFVPYDGARNGMPP